MNGRRAPTGGYGLLGALQYFGLPSLDAEEKDAMRALALRGGPWQPGEPEALLDYCQTDVDALLRALAGARPEARLGRLAMTLAFQHALFRGAFMVALARTEAAGVPLDHATLTAIRDAREALRHVALRDAQRGVGVLGAGAARRPLDLQTGPGRGLDRPPGVGVAEAHARPGTRVSTRTCWTRSGACCPRSRASRRPAISRTGSGSSPSRWTAMAGVASCSPRSARSRAGMRRRAAGTSSASPGGSGI